MITLANGTTFVYNNSFGGYCAFFFGPFHVVNTSVGVQDPQDPYNNDARPNSWTPPLNTSWEWGQDRVYGVNLGGLFVLEPFITPDIFQRYPTAVDEYSLSVAMVADTANGGLQQLEDHYNTFIVEHPNQSLIPDIIVVNRPNRTSQKLLVCTIILPFLGCKTESQTGSGLNFIRVPIPFWAIETWPGADEPFLAKTSWKWVLSGNVL